MREPADKCLGAFIAATAYQFLTQRLRSAFSAVGSPAAEAFEMTPPVLHRS